MIVERKRMYSYPGDQYDPIYEPILNDDGTIELVVTGQKDNQEYIQSFAEDCSIQSILRRYSLGDDTVLQKVQGFYADTTVMPKTYRDILDSVIQGRTMFDQLPIDVKQKFNNDFNQFFVAIGSDEWMEALGYQKSDDVVKDEVKDSGES